MSVAIDENGNPITGEGYNVTFGTDGSATAVIGGPTGSDGQLSGNGSEQDPNTTNTGPTGGDPVLGGSGAAAFSPTTDPDEALETYGVGEQEATDTEAAVDTYGVGDSEGLLGDYGSDNADGSIDQDQTALGLYEGLLNDPNNTLMQTFQTQALQRQNATGNLNTSMTETAVIAGVAQGMAPYVLQDAQTFAELNRMGYGHDLEVIAAGLQQNIDVLNTAQAADIATAAAAFNHNLGVLGMTQATDAGLQAQTWAHNLQTIMNEQNFAHDEQQWITNSFTDLARTWLNDMAVIMTNRDLTAAQKEEMIKQGMDWVNSSLETLAGVNNFEYYANL